MSAKLRYPQEERKDAECIKEAERRQREEAKEGRLPG